MAIRWQFIEDNEHDVTYWTWRNVGVDEAIEAQSNRFANYGTAMGDAIRHGFRPREQHWIVVTPKTITHFRPGERPVTIPLLAEGFAGRDAALRLRGRRNPYSPKHAGSGKKVSQ